MALWQYVFLAVWSAATRPKYHKAITPVEKNCYLSFENHHLPNLKHHAFKLNLTFALRLKIQAFWVREQ